MSDEPDEREHLRTAARFSTCLEWPPGEKTFLLGSSEGSFSLYAGSAHAFHFDLEGRLRRAYVDGTHYLRGLDGKVLRKTLSRGSSDTGASPAAAPGDADEARQLHDLVRVTAERALEALPSSEGPFAEARALLALAASFTPERLALEIERFREAYAPLAMLPPDRYKALILQATLGCAYGKCAFCSLYHGVRYRRKTPEEFREHVRKVKRFLGKALPLKSGVFLGEANALELPDVERIVEVVLEEVPDQVRPGPGRRGGLSAFTDVFQEPFKSREELERLRSMGLDRVYLGVESGDDGILRALRKPATGRSASKRVESLKAAGVPVGVIFLVGAGGQGGARAHVEGTVSLTEALHLDSGDVVYLSPLHMEGSLGEEELRAQEGELTERLRSLGLRVSRYDLRSFVYS
jgi:hypothetical protein